jgi:hypothetical protein
MKTRYHLESVLFLFAVCALEKLHADCALAPSGLIAWWRAEGDALDSAGSNQGTVDGVTFSGGKVGQAFLFDGVNDGVNLGNVPAFDFAPDSSFSFEAWFKSFGPTPPPNDSQAILVLNNNCGNTAQFLSLRNLDVSYGVVEFFLRDANGVFASTASPPVSSNQFHHVVGVREVNGAVKTLRLHVDGVLVDTETDPSTGALTLSAADWIGRRNTCGTDSVFNGIIDEISVYNRALNTEEVHALFNAGSAGKCDPNRPTLNIAALPGAVRLTWTTNATGYLLETNSALTLPAGWGVLTSNYSVLNTNFAVTNALGPAARFYRLRKP